MSLDPAVDLGPFVLRDESGVVVVSFGLLCTLYLRPPFDPARRTTIRDFINRYADLTKDELRWLMPTKSGAHPLDPASLVEELDGKLASIGGDDGWELQLHGGTEARAASDVGLEVSLRRQWEAEAPHNHLSFVSFHFPLGWFGDRLPDFVSFIAGACDMLQPVHGYAGVGVVPPADRLLAARFDETIASLAERFPGLEIDYPAKHLVWVRAGIKGVNWLTILGDNMLERDGGRDGLCAALPPTASVHEYRGGVIVQASPAPLIGDRSRGIDVDAYRPVARALAPIRISMHSGVHGTEGLDRARFERWLARFD